jgi:hypothetical protein
MFFFPLFDENATSRRPVIVWLIIAACVFAFFWQQSLDGIAAEVAIYQFGFVPAIVFKVKRFPPNLSLFQTGQPLSLRCFCMVAGYILVATCCIYGFLAIMSKIRWAWSLHYFLFIMRRIRGIGTRPD